MAASRVHQEKQGDAMRTTPPLTCAFVAALQLGAVPGPTELVSRNDVVYHTPSVEPWEAMPVGGGDLSAMVRCDGRFVDLHLTKSDAWGVQAPPEAPLGTRFFNNVSPGHVRLDLGTEVEGLAAVRFRQRLDLRRGRVVLELGSAGEPLRLAVWGHPELRVLVVEVTGALNAVLTVELSEWRDTMTVQARGHRLVADERQTRAAAPHMVTSGMHDRFDARSDPLLDRGTAVVVGATGPVVGAGSEGETARFDLPLSDGTATVVIACEVTPKGSAVSAAHQTLARALDVGIEAMRAEHTAWWEEYWSRSMLAILGSDRMAEWLTASYYVHLYTLGCVNRGPVPAKWDGGPGLMRGDERTWGLAEWIQEIRFTYLPLYTANRLDMARGLTDHYSAMRGFLREQTCRMWALPGLWIPETVLPWGGVEDWALDGSRPCLEHFVPWSPETAPYGRFEKHNPYVGLLFTCGPELCRYYLTFYRHTCDEEFLRTEAYPMLRDVAAFLSALLREGEDGRFHLAPANALETWWAATDPADALDGIRWLFTEFAAVSEQFDTDHDLRHVCLEQLARLPEPSVGVMHPDGSLDTTVDAYAPVAATGTPPHHSNFENPALYRLFPFGLSGIGSADYGRTLRTFENRIFPLNQSWSMDAIWAARLGLGRQAAALLAEHTRRWNRFRYGGWDSGNSSVFPGNLAVVPYMDGAGVACCALHEMLLQSHDGTIRVLPSVPRDWSGVCCLHAEGGFAVGFEFVNGQALTVSIKSEHGNVCRVQNPWNSMVEVREETGAPVCRTDARVLVFSTLAGGCFRLSPLEPPAPLTENMLEIDTAPYPGPGLRGRAG
jgi:hypothetical protein